MAVLGFFWWRLGWVKLGFDLVKGGGWKWSPGGINEGVKRKSKANGHSRPGVWYIFDTLMNGGLNAVGRGAEWLVSEWM